MPICFCCGRTDFKDNIELAQHIVVSKKGHVRSKTWASKVLLNVRKLNRKGNLPERSSATEEERDAIKETKAEIRLELSGETEVVVAGCPTCKQAHQVELPLEFTRSGFAWRTKSGLLITRCAKCKTI